MLWIDDEGDEDDVVVAVAVAVDVDVAVAGDEYEEGEDAADIRAYNAAAVVVADAFAAFVAAEDSFGKTD